MTEREQIEQQIRDVLAADSDAIAFSNKLFQQEIGLFARLGRTLDERREIIRSELWRSAQAKLRELEQRNLERFRGVVKQVEEGRAPGSHDRRLETTDQSRGVA